MIDDIKEDAKTRMVKSIESLRQEFSKVRTGRAHTSLLDHIRVSYYGSEVPLNQVANVSVQDPRTLGVSPWEKKMVPDVEKAIRDSDLGLNPVTTGDLIRVPLPALTEERSWGWDAGLEWQPPWAALREYELKVRSSAYANRKQNHQK